MTLAPGTKLGPYKLLSSTGAAGLRSGVLLPSNTKEVLRRKSPWNRARTAAGYPWMRIHDLRHAYAIKLAERMGLPMETISEMLGHAKIEFIKRHYAKYSPSWTGRVVLATLNGGKSAKKEISNAMAKKVAIGIASGSASRTTIA